MCGIAGQIVVTPGARVDLNIVPRTASLLAHRGPDGWGYVVDARQEVLLLNTRLAIVDVAGGRQPISNEDGEIWVTLNGECYGFEHQRRWLQMRGHCFRTRTDTEVLVHLYEELGERFVERLRGEYAFALHDRRRGVCLLVRDRFGIKPLVFTEHGGRLIFASEAKALFADERIERRLDHEQIFHVLGGVFIPERTLFHGVHQVDPGTFVRVEVGRGWRRARYWSLPLPRGEDGAGAGAHFNEADAVAAFGDKLRESTRLRLHGDVEVGAYLSGGVDSAAILKAIHGAAPVRTFTVGFETAAFDETSRAAAVADHFRTPHETVRIGPGDLAEPFVASLWHSETPVVNAHGAAKFLLSRLASSRVKVVLTGEGADEVLAGYPQFRHQQLLDAVHRAPRDRDAARRLAEFSATRSVFSGTVPITRYPDYDRVVSRFGVYPYPLTRVRAYQRPVRWLLSSELRRNAATVDTLAALDTSLGPHAFDGFDPVTASQYLLFRTELPGYILTNLGDRAEMAHGVEGRVPFLDHELVELACALPQGLKLGRHRNKHVLRCFLDDMLPETANREKQVFLAPSTRALGLDRGDAPLSAWVTPRAVRETNVFNALGLSLVQRVVRRATHGTRRQTLAEAVLVFATSVQILDGLLCRDFSAACRRYAPDPTRFDLVFGRVDEPAVVE
jgi:asparagine synthase (glutamine-hydrolysing)